MSGPPGAAAVIPLSLGIHTLKKYTKLKSKYGAAKYGLRTSLAGGTTHTILLLVLRFYL